jgi:hypothetical protein
MLSYDESVARREVDARIARLEAEASAVRVSARTDHPLLNP